MVFLVIFQEGISELSFLWGKTTGYLYMFMPRLLPRHWY